jgi:hypothetical protein
MVTPWYKQFWPWFLIFLPLSVVVGTLYVVYLFTINSVDLVAEDYYKKGKGINVDLSQVSVAKQLQLNAEIYSEQSQIIVKFDKGELTTYPAINVVFTHRTLPNQDFSYLATADASGTYKLQLNEPLEGPWFVELMPHNKEWLIQGRINFPSSTPVPLMN